MAAARTRSDLRNGRTWSAPRSRGNLAKTLSAADSLEQDTAAGSPASAPDRFTIGEVIGEGGCGKVHRAFDHLSQEHVALKRIGPRLGPGAAQVERMRRELRAARRIAHPDVVRTHELFEWDGEVFLSMELVDGPTLAEVIRRDGPLSAAALVTLATTLAEALAAVHRAGVVHRDVKPSNLMLRPGGRPVLMDFGISRLEDGAPIDGAMDGRTTGALTQTGALVGTPLYMAPEQLDGARATAAADVYAVGLVLWEAATGHRPHRGACVEDLAAHRRKGARGSLAEHRPDLAPGFCAIVERCLAALPGRRPRDGGALTRALRRASWPRPRRVLTLAAILGLAAAGLGFAASGPAASAFDGRWSWTCCNGRFYGQGELRQVDGRVTGELGDDVTHLDSRIEGTAVGKTVRLVRSFAGGAQAWELERSPADGCLRGEIPDIPYRERRVELCPLR